MYKLTKQGNNYNYPIHLYICDTLEDLNSIPLFKDIESNIGSEAYIISTSEKFVRNSDGIWKKCTSEHSDITVDQHYNSESENAQSGKAVTEALISANPIPRIVQIPYSENIALTPNQINDISVLAGSVSITLENGMEGYDNEWVFIVTQGVVAQSIALPIIAWDRGIAPTFEANTETEVRLYYRNNILRGMWL